MLLLLLIGLTLTAVAAVMFARLFVMERPPPVRLQAQIDAYGFAAGPGADATPRPLTGRIDALAATVGALLGNHMKNFQEDGLRKELQAAGLYTMSPRKFMGYRMLSTLILPAIWIWFGSVTGAGAGRFMLGLAFAVAFGWQGPMILVRRRARTRLEEIDSGMPELVDLLVTTVEAGVGFAAALQLVARRVQGPLGQELRITLQEQNMGLTIESALENMLERVDSVSVRAFVQAMVQGQTLGVSIGRILRDLALDMRKRRRQMAEERAQKAPTKILFPLVFLILPALFIVVLGGPLIGLANTLGSLA
jgi:tight adherence protein C